MKKAAIIIPAYNEEKRIEKTLEAYSNFFNFMKRNAKLDYEILVVINNTTDKTEEIVKKWRDRCDNIGYINLLRGGKGYAIIEGFKDALIRRNDFIGFVDADMATNPEEYYKLVYNLNNCDGAIADRYLKDSEVFPPATFRRLIVSRIFNFLIRALLFLNYRDTQCGAKIFRRNTIEKIIPQLSMSQWAFDVELLYLLKNKGFKIISVPTKWYDREYSKINFLRAGPWMLLGVLRLRILNSPLRKFIKIYDRLIKFIPR
ncbi:MAG: glycosyltransferase [Nanoarchaeota archaeon]